ncbi:MAG: WecB/TagA/CpsF family glycosyltransferase [Bacteroidaceae bacterium]|nr:WecB/TagA/CpsF family glycosyltransferase [Bacteroidaceae bacterium]
MTKPEDFFRIGRVRISVTDEDWAIQTIKDAIHKREKGYVCISTLRTVPIANRDDCYQEVMENSLMNTPDGTPLVWCGHWWGLKQVQRACGPHIFPRMLKDKEPQLKHFFLGDTDETLAALTKKATEEFGAQVVGSYSPPFAPLEEYDMEGIAKMINDSGATIVWTSLRAPKQDYLNARLMPYLNDGIVCLGVGAAFRSVLGVLKVPDGFLQKMGLAGLLFKRPETTWWSEFTWYVEHVAYLIKYFFTIEWRKLTGKKYFEK